MRYRVSIKNSRNERKTFTVVAEDQAAARNAAMREFRHFYSKTGAKVFRVMIQKPVTEY